MKCEICLSEDVSRDLDIYHIILSRKFIVWFLSEWGRRQMEAQLADVPLVRVEACYGCMPHLAPTWVQYQMPKIHDERKAARVAALRARIYPV